MKYTLPFFFFFVTSFPTVPSHALEFSQALAVRSALLVSRAEGFETKTQGASIFELSATLSGEYLGLALAAGYHSVEASNLSDGYSYRGFDGFHGFAALEWYPFGVVEGEAGGPNPLPRPGLSCGIGGFFSKYEYTDILFFYPSLRASLFSEFFFTGSVFRVRFELPAEIYLRKDLASSFSLGFGAWGVLSWSGVAARPSGSAREAPR